MVRSKYDLSLRTPLMNASGSLGFVPGSHGPVDLDRLGAFVTDPISLAPRTPAHGRHYQPFSGGFLLHTGYPNPGLSAAIRRWASRWARSAVPVWVHLIPSRVSEVSEMIARLERVEGVRCVEIGLPPEIDAGGAAAFARAAAGELPVVLRLPFERAEELVESLADTFLEVGLAAISLAPPRGALPSPEGPVLHGRVYGPAVFPLALAAVQGLAKRGLPVIAAGGIYRPEEVEAMLQAGASAVQLDAVLWRGGFFPVQVEG